MVHGATGWRGFKCHAGWLCFIFPTKGRKKNIRNRRNVNAPSPHLSQNETPLWLPFSSTHGVFSGKRDSEKNTFAFTNCMKPCPGFDDKGSGLGEVHTHLSVKL